MTDNNAKFEILIEELIMLNNERGSSWEEEKDLKRQREEKQKEIQEALPELNPMWKRFIQLKSLGII